MDDHEFNFVLDWRVMNLPLRLEAKVTLLILKSIAADSVLPDAIGSLSFVSHLLGCSESSTRRQVKKLSDVGHIEFRGWQGGGRFAFRVVGFDNDGGGDTPQDTPLLPPSNLIQQVVANVKPHVKEEMTADATQQTTAGLSCHDDSVSYVRPDTIFSPYFRRFAVLAVFG